MIKKLDLLIANLPRFTEEGSDASRISKEELIRRLQTESLGRQNVEVVEVLVNFIEEFFSTLCLLDWSELKNGYWKFVSHPAQLCALAVLKSIADPSQRLLPTDFWQTAGVTDYVKQEQKAVLKAIEDRRRNHRVDGSAPPPIRFIYVAWGIIKLDDKILFHRREAKEHSSEYGFVGGRCNLQDLKKVLGEDTPIERLLEALQSADSEAMFSAMEHTLSRELQEETQLAESNNHYEASLWRELKPYSDCMGAAPNYAFTQYFFRLYHIKLTIKGYFALRHSIEERGGDLIACGLPEISVGCTSDEGKTLRIDALYRDFEDNRTALQEALARLPASYVNQYKYKDDRDGLIVSPHASPLQGNSGSEQPLRVDLDENERAWLLILAGHSRGWVLTLSSEDSVTLRDYSWIETHNEEIKETLSRLAEKLRVSGSPMIQNMDSRYFRLSVAPDLIFLEPAWFDCSLDANSETARRPKITILRRQITTLIGDVQADHKDVVISRKLAGALKKVAEGELTAPEQEDLPRSIRSALQTTYQAMGLRRLLFTEEKRYLLACR